jgi:hypothetical protein
MCSESYPLPFHTCTTLICMPTSSRPSYTHHFPAGIRHLLNNPTVLTLHLDLLHFPPILSALEIACSLAGTRWQELHTQWAQGLGAPVWSRPWLCSIILSLCPYLMQQQCISPMMPTPSTWKTVVPSCPHASAGLQLQELSGHRAQAHLFKANPGFAVLSCSYAPAWCGWNTSP